MNTWDAVITVVSMRLGKALGDCEGCGGARRCAMGSAADRPMASLGRLICFAECMGYKLCIVPADSVPERAAVIDSLD